MFVAYISILQSEEMLLNHVYFFSVPTNLKLIADHKCKINQYQKREEEVVKKKDTIKCR